MAHFCSEQTAREIDEEVKAILAAAYAAAKQTLESHRDKLGKISEALLDRETLDAQTFQALFKSV